MARQNVRFGAAHLTGSATSNCRNTGPTLDQVAEVLTAAARDQRMRALSMGKLNPARCAGDPDTLPRFIPSIARILAATTH
jgi:hypothetical protein